MNVVFHGDLVTELLMLCRLFCWLRCVDPCPRYLCQQKLPSADAVMVRKLLLCSHSPWDLVLVEFRKQLLAGAVLPVLGIGCQSVFLCF